MRQPNIKDWRRNSPKYVRELVMTIMADSGYIGAENLGVLTGVGRLSIKKVIHCRRERALKSYAFQYMIESMLPNSTVDRIRGLYPWETTVVRKKGAQLPGILKESGLGK